ncbi:MAG: hypothetical protein ACXAC7_22955 [Candidatus Hodarchaeales archaeon]|jgi:hypothetical protein
MAKTKAELLEELLPHKHGIKGDFPSYIVGDNNRYQLRIYESCLKRWNKDLLKHKRLFDYNESYEFWHGKENVIVVKGK